MTERHDGWPPSNRDTGCLKCDTGCPECPVSRARASKELGELFAKALQAPHAHQVGVCARLGILDYMHFDWMRAQAEPGTPVALYRLEVLRGLDEQRSKDLTDIATDVEAAAGTHAATILNMRKWRHESRFKRFYDDTTKVEHSGPNGGPIDVRDLSKAKDAELLSILDKTVKDPDASE